MQTQDLIEIAGAIADGSPVDWNAHSDLPPAIANGLRLIDRLARAHARLPSVSVFSSSLHQSLMNLSNEEILGLDTPVAWGSLTVLEKIGRGTYGDVYRAHDPRLSRDVALKLLRQKDRRETAVIDEGHRLARVRHPNVVTVYGAERIDGRVGLWMEYIEGQTLEQELADRGRLPAAELNEIARALCGALAAVHKAGILHRDLKAQNVMRDAEGRLVVTDFGAGRDLDADADVQRRELAGTPLYMAPEVLNGASASAASDIYSLGVLLYRLATASFPVQGRTLEELRAAHARRTVGRLRAIRPDLPSRFSDAVDSALAFNPSSRFASADAFLAAVTEPPMTRSGIRVGVAATAIVVGVVAMAAWMSRPSGAVDADPVGHAPRRIAVSDSLMITDVSRDGRWAVGVEWLDSGSSMLTLLDTITGRAKSVETGDGHASAPVLSPNGRTIVYRSGVRPLGEPGRMRYGFLGNQGLPSSLMLADADSEAPQRRLTAFSGRQSGIPIDWSLDGRSVLTLISDRGSEDARTLLAWMSTTGESRRVVKTFPAWRHAGDAALSPDGQRIAYVAAPHPGSEDTSIYVVAADGTQEIDAVRMVGLHTRPIWTADSRHLVFCSDRSGRRDLWSVDVTAGTPAGEPRLIYTNFAGDPLEVLASGALIYSQKIGGAPLEFVVERHPTAPRVVQTFLGEKGQWSRQGHAIAFIRRNPPNRDLIVRSLDESRETRYPNPSLAMEPPHWLPGDREILFYVGGEEEGDGSKSFYSLDVDSRVITRRFAKDTPRENRSAAGALAPDGRTLWLAYRPAGDPQAPWQGVVGVDAATGAERLRVPIKGAFPSGFNGPGLSFSPDGTRLAILTWDSFEDRLAGLWTLHLASGRLDRICGPFSADYTAHIATWAPDGRQILFVTTERSGLARVMRVSAEGGTPQFDGIDSTLLAAAVPTVRLHPRQGFTINLHPDGKRIAFAASTRGASELWTIADIFNIRRTTPSMVR